MKLAVVRSSTLLGVDGYPVQVEVHVTQGLPTFTIVGLPDASCREARDRVRAAIATSGLKWPDTRITVNLAPTHLRKSGAALDLAIAVGILAASNQLASTGISGFAFLGELGLDGSLRPVLGALPLVHALGDARPVVPADNVVEARLVHPDACVARTLREVVEALAGRQPWPQPADRARRAPRRSDEADLDEVQGQPVAKRALEVAAAGGHHILMCGPPGAGKTMLAERVPGLLPDLDDELAFDVSRIHSAAGRFDHDDLIRRPPFRAPHHSASLVALLGGGSTTLRPGEVSLATSGVLFLDELGEFPAAHLDALRQPLESGRIHISRAATAAVLPARFLLVAATNPCPCGVGRWGDCRCSNAALARYARRLSGPLLDRFDIRLAVERPDATRVLGATREGPTTGVVRERVVAARALAAQRGVRCNRELGGQALELHAPLTATARAYLRSRLAEGLLTMRGAQRVRAMALTIKDLEGTAGAIDEIDLQEALLLRGEEPTGGGLL